MGLNQIDSINTLMAQYVCGRLSVPQRILVEAHLEMKPDNRGFVRNLEAMAGVALEQLAPTDIKNRNTMLSSIFTSSPDTVVSQMDDINQNSVGHQAHTRLPKSLRKLFQINIDDIPWQYKLPGYKEYDLGNIDGCNVNMFWARAGRAMPAHTHKGCELSIVIEGSFRDERGYFGPGDISVADASINHRPVVESDFPCLGCTVLNEGITLTGSWRQLVSDLIG